MTSELRVSGSAATANEVEPQKPTSEQPLPEKIRRRFELLIGNRVITFSELVNFSQHDPEVGYYSGANADIELFGVNQEPLIYPEIEGIGEFMRIIHKLHAENPGAYKTPVEIHSPCFGIGVAREMEVLFELGQLEPVVYEIGAGRATLARDILDYWQMYSPEIYKKVRYRIVDSSKKLVEMQKELLSKHSGKVKWVIGDARELPFQADSLEGVLVNTELLDTLPVVCLKRVKKEFEFIASIEEFVEIGYQLEEGILRETEIPLSNEARTILLDDPDLLVYSPHRIRPKLNIEVGEKGYLGTGPLKFYKELTRVFKKGYVVSFDYRYLLSQAKGGYMEMSIHNGAGELTLQQGLGQADIYFGVDPWLVDNYARRNGLEAIQFHLQQGRFFHGCFGGDTRSDPYKAERIQLLFENDWHGAPPLFADFSNTFALVHSIGLGESSDKIHDVRSRVVQEHQEKYEDLTLGRRGKKM